jgi:hypothetical protein
MQVKKALGGLASLYDAKMDAKAQVAKDVKARAQPQFAAWDKKFNAIFSGRNQMCAIPQNAGDLWNLAENDKDPSWRMAGVMWLGYMKSQRGVSEAAVNAYLAKRATTETNSLIRDKAKEAADFPMAESANFVREP